MNTKIRQLAVNLVVVFILMFSAMAQSQDINKVDDKGQKHGPWKGYYPESKRLKYEGTFDHGKETGVFTFFDDTKAQSVVATRDFSKGSNSAYTKFFDQKKNIVSEGNVVNKKFDGLWKFYHKESKTIMTEEHYRNGKLDGKRTVYYPDGKIAEVTNYKNGKKEGPYRKYTEKGTVLEETTYKNGIYEGSALFRDPEGNIVAKGNFKNGGKDGYWEFYEMGKLKSREKFPVSSRPRTKKSKPAADTQPKDQQAKEMQK